MLVLSVLGGGESLSSPTDDNKIFLLYLCRENLPFFNFSAWMYLFSLCSPIAVHRLSKTHVFGFIYRRSPTSVSSPSCLLLDTFWHLIMSDRKWHGTQTLLHILVLFHQHASLDLKSEKSALTWPQHLRVLFNLSYYMLRQVIKTFN